MGRFQRNFMAIISDFGVECGWGLLVVSVDASSFGMIELGRLRVSVGMVVFFLYVCLGMLS